MTRKGKQKKPPTYRRFEELAKQIIAVPRDELEKKMETYNKDKEKRKSDHR